MVTKVLVETSRLHRYESRVGRYSDPQSRFAYFTKPFFGEVGDPHWSSSRLVVSL